MGIFSFIKKKEKPQLSPKQTIKRIIEYMPKIYEEHRQFKNSKEFFEQNEFGLSLESLVELADETGHYFSEEFWDQLANSARKMKMDKIAEYCDNQSKRNITELGFKIPFGWTEIKSAENVFQANISEKLKKEWNSKRRVKDKVDKLLNKNGVHLKSRGRGGHIYYVENGKLAEFEWELEVGGIRLWFESESKWCLPTESELKKEDKKRIKNSIVEWAKQKKEIIKFD
ncbi:hypothetical protein [uncultured Maribacter sp.]|uniref:hypothetical protein n=1 Tax=uncultured Maribacter sp. TaxID=431308 RepID=UPI002605ED62|nr:hypothetical protein [uncultured Maribacter sp.]